MKNKYSVLLSFIIVASFSFFAFQSSTQIYNSSTTSSSVLITEVLYDSPNANDANEEWIELYNPSPYNVDLTGWTISDNSESFSLSGTIGSGEYLIFSRNGTRFNELYGFFPNVSILSLALSNSGDYLRLADDSSTEIDMVSWENYITGWSIGGTDQTINRRRDLNGEPIDSDIDSDWNTGDFQDLGTPGSGYQLFISEEPIISFISPSPANNSDVKGEITININASDPDGISSYELTINNSIVTTTSEYVWNTTDEILGNYIITANTVNDTLNNWGQSTLILTVVNDTSSSTGNYSTFKLMSYNIEAGGADPSWIDVVKEENADILILVETGDWDDNSNQKLNQAVSELNTYFVNEDPYEGYTDQGAGTFSGIAILSRFDIMSFTDIETVTLDNSFVLSPSHDFAHAELDLLGETIHVIGSHLKCCSGFDNEVKRENAQEGINNYMDALGDVPIIYGGDLNSFSPVDTSNNGDLSDGPVDTLINNSNPKTTAIHTWRDVHKTLNPSVNGHTYTSAPYSSRIDFIFVNQFFFDSLIASTTGGTASANAGSDHLSVDVIIGSIENPLTTSTSSKDSSSQKDNSTISGNMSTAPGFEMIIFIISFGGLFIRRKKN